MILGLDQTERNFSYFGGVVALILAAIFIPRLLKNTWITETAKPKGTTCPTGYTYHASECTKQVLTHPSYWVPQFLIALIIGLVMLAFAYRRKRAGVVTCALLLGLSMGTTGFIFLLLGGWLVVRAFRLQKFGDATFKGSNARAREMAQAKKEGRVLESSGSSASDSSSKSGSKSAKASTKPSTPAPSKRYTPKQQPRKR